MLYDHHKASNAHLPTKIIRKLVILIVSALITITAATPLDAQSLDDIAVAPAQPANNMPDKTKEQKTAPIVDIISSKQSEAKKMKSKQWDTSTYKERIEKKKEEEEEEEEENNETKANEKEETNTENKEETKNLTDSQKIWNHYYNLANKGKKEKEDQLDADSAQAAEPEEPQNEESKARETKNTNETTQNNSGIGSILERYKETQRNKGRLNSRSFGSIE
ncbi:MAG: hypothetical protein ACLFP8_04525 [Alphaproteobacteria bacterium]